MASRFPLIGGRTTISGDVAFFRYYIEFAEEEFADSPRYPWYLELRSELQSELSDLTKSVLGSQFEVRSLSMRTGSLEVLVVVGTSYYVISRWKNFVESVDLLSEQMRGLIERIIGIQGPPVRQIQGTWSPAGELIYAMHRNVDTSSSPPGYGLLLTYLILSHAVLLAVLLWLAVTQ